MVHTFKEIRTRTPANPSKAAPEAAMRQAAWKALLRHAVQGLRPPHTPTTLRRWLQTPEPQAWAIGAPQAPAHPSTTTPGKERARAREGQGKGKDNPARGQGEVQGSREPPTGTGHQGRHNAGGRNQQRARKGKDQGPWHRGRGRNDGDQGADTARAQHRPTPSRSRRTPAKMRRRTTNLTPHEPHQLTPADHWTPHRGRRADPHRKKGLHSPGEPPRTHPRSPPPRPRRQATTPAAATATTQARGQAPKEEAATAATPRIGGKDPRRHRTTTQAPRKCIAADTRLTHQPERHTGTPAARIQRTTAHLTVPPSHQPAYSLGPRHAPRNGPV